MSQVPGDGPAQAHADFVDPDDFARRVDQRSPGVAAIDLCVMPDPADQRADIFPLLLEAPHGAEKAGHHHFHIAHDAERERNKS